LSPYLRKVGGKEERRDTVFTVKSLEQSNSNLSSFGVIAAQAKFFKDKEERKVLKQLKPIA
jgi:hypothetical protein